VPVSLTQKRVMLQPVGDDETSFSALHGVCGPVVGDVTARRCVAALTCSVDQQNWNAEQRLLGRCGADGALPLLHLGRLAERVCGAVSDGPQIRLAGVHGA
jgi:hypothetical protein